jgi:CheY-like chemotaxis protein
VTDLAEARSQAESAARSKANFLSNMSHEIRTPLTAILGYTDLLREAAIRHRAPEEQLQSIGTIRRAGEHLLTVINDILDISKIEAGRLEIERVEMDLPQVLFDVDSMMRSRAAEKGLQLNTRLLSAIPNRILSDPTRLRQILMNLVGNATKFTSRGQVDIEVEVRSDTNEPTVRIAVVDTGSGLAPEAAARLFQPFMQADTSVTRKHGGTGLGLTICQRLARLMGGDVTLMKTAPDEGSTFVLTLPLHAVDGALAVEDLRGCVGSTDQCGTGAQAIGLHGRILLAEDGEDNQRLISHHLRKAGAEVIVAEHGVRALELMAEADVTGRPFNLLVSDMQMPEMDGYTLARTLRAQGNAIPIIALTAHAMAEDRQKCLDAGCNDYATKPIDRNSLVASCARVLRSSTVSVPERTTVDASTSRVMPSELREDRRPVDPESRRVLHSELRDDPEFAELVEVFVAGLPATLSRIDDAFRAGDLLDLARVAHQIKGAAGGYGYPLISDLARTVEQHAKDRATADGAFDPGSELSEAVALLVDQCGLAITTLQMTS